ncbi:putative gluconeogenesis factor [Melissococcus plutonius]|uniref:gluconeogenesis factor YvcK family protein n=1 Tax=Melissococcus plutonius TaxID=33970 RepID=UPI00065DE434|nr:YvcK family protein [Melissococcus plutonius]KMT26439.1 putative gluconeogenesis factor [Melissococcus plutonius]KMT27689.1 putative gluconeogenesis factor [Melissococcus plutonius]
MIKNSQPRKPKIAIIGGGTGLPVILKSLRNQNVDITAIITVADDGGSSGEIRTSMQMTPPGDLRNVLVALSDMPQLYEDIFQYRFKASDQYFANHAIGNLIIAALTEMRESTYEAIQLLSKLMHVDGHIYPSSEEPLILHAVFEDGTRAIGESNIATDRKVIDHVYVTNMSDEKQQPKAARKVVKAIHEADMIVLGPGSLFTSILPNLVINEIAEAIKQTTAEVVYICNIMTQKGETEHFTDADHVRVLNKHLDTKFIDTVLVNTEKIPDGYMDPTIYDEYLVQVEHDFSGLRNEGCRVISTNFLKLRNSGVFHDGNRVVDELFKIVFGAK